MMTLLSDPNTPPTPGWQSEFEVAMRSGELQAAKAAVFSRLRAKAERPPGMMERIALNDAIHLLKLFRSERIR
jgi:hypothetical protein